MSLLGKLLVHPSHGPAKVVRVESRKLGGVTQELLALELVEGGMTMLVPADALEEIGLREPMSADDASQVLEVLVGKVTLPTVKGQWARQFKAYSEQARSGDPQDRAIVVRDLSSKPTPSMGETRLLNQTRVMLAAELGAALGVTLAEAEQQIVEACGKASGNELVTN